MNLNMPEFTVLSDHSDIECEESDLFALGSRLGPVFDIVRHRDTDLPLAAGLFGHSGLGKTTALRWLESRINQWNQIPVGERLGHPEVFPVWFSVARHELGCIRSHLFSLIILTCLEALDKEGFRQHLLSKAVGLFAGKTSGSTGGRLQELARAWGLEDLASTLAASGDSGEDCPHISNAACQSFINEWKQSCEATGRPVRIAVLVDDLDHCPPVIMMEIFETIVSGLRSSVVAYVVGLDQEVARNLISNHFGEHGYDEMQTRRYLGKVFQVECHIEPSMRQIKGYYDMQFNLLNHRIGGLLEMRLSLRERSSIDAAILHLAGYNPRKIKLLLNSALARAYSVCRLPQDGGSHAGKENLFAQCIQAYLLQRWMTYFSVGSAALMRNDVLEWFEALSREACKPDSDYALVRDHLLGDESLRGGGLRPSLRGQDAHTQATRFLPPEGLGFNMIHEWVWNLLKIPFDPEVYRHQGYPVSIAETPGTVLSNQEFWAKASVALKDALAASLEKSSVDLTAYDLQNTTSLALSGLTLSDDDIQIIARLYRLEKLDLYDANVRDVSWLSGLQQLKVLNLSCSGVSDLSPLGELVNLQVLDLSCTEVKDLSPLTAMRHLVQLVLYGTPVESIAPLKGMPSLARLNLTNTKVDETGLDVLHSLPALQNLFLRGSGISRATAMEFNKAFGFELKIEV